MRVRWLTLFLALAAVGVGLGLSPAAAQTAPVVDVLRVSVWPEYDQPAALLLYRLSLAPSTALPAPIRLPIPASVTDLNAVATLNAQGSLVDAVYTRETAGNVSWVVMNSASLEIQIEFYLPLARSGDTRSFTFTWPGGLAASDFVFEAQEPVGATDFQMEPAAQSASAGEFGLTYRQARIGPLDAAATPVLAISYRRTTDQFSAVLVAEQTPLGTPESAGGGTPDLSTYLPWALLALGLLLMAGGVIYYVRTLRPSARNRQRHRPATSEAPDDGEGIASTVYCHNCGTRASASDRFCRRCGTQLRH